ncbi:heavy-metal-associated domain-containing protein [Streptomyces mobaraensis NBRC 13819 = DSM 40847]|uniref:Heavy-metal-associated domain-containing protein n=2 Tax=Streptomyces mobaraensis TaxID=35621 RepID=A0A5N5W862_STRMB|nr:cation transporter [Streptomyces mobaraensis]EMF02377.1 Copper chaperone [Streptomyces mobaraensis NBRC 13819 = DSM 40847]KAB7845506.1 heavy-metal-associated domain-containing protein [Streptomyces mobaraensis]QTT76971.1 heavy-metal-associated domain-containing protein [Streptomyces mobaraensis NBRC 13819 = DSM 40847]
MSTPNATAPTVTTTYAVTGMSCGHCESAVTEAVGALGAVRAVKVDVAAGRVTVTTAGEPDDAAVAEAVDDAGYELAGRV